MKVDVDKFFTPRNVALFGTISIHVFLMAIFSHLYLGGNGYDTKQPDLVIDFTEEVVQEEQQVKEEKADSENEKVASNNIMDEFNESYSNQASSKSNENSIESLRSSMKSLNDVRGDKGEEAKDLFSDDAIDRKVDMKHYVREEETEGSGNADRSAKNAFTGNSTVNYYLKNRYNDRMPSPVYTCIEGGTVYVNIEVNQQGSVVNVKFDKKKSTTTNQCLKETALDYAKKAKFNSDFKASEIQKGNISYTFRKQ
ncbi:MAG: hypothetical protein KAG96_06855 [Ichthyobacteriaceae bacterium]|nr:hypothetical protein [Ichthyobacteriaceae bacterium]